MPCNCPKCKSKLRTASAFRVGVRPVAAAPIAPAPVIAAAEPVIRAATVHIASPTLASFMDAFSQPDATLDLLGARLAEGQGPIAAAPPDLRTLSTRTPAPPPPPLSSIVPVKKEK